MITQATSILATGSTDLYEKQNLLNPNNIDHNRREGDYDFIGAVRQVMQDNGLDTSDYDNHQIIRDAATLRPAGQRHLVNRYLRHQIMTVRAADSIIVRTHLIEDGEFSDWLRLFGEGIIPFMKEHGLPKKLF